ncbi:unnamed protein product [Trichogramma brassicae]|uniref:Uncharacterized protein n=1 Tax=Trichogramma brassicae TaxID=86971 RepID=A0A6H5J1W1_9HYME|nr:unnamed protein product [Trichogramma brassicae]
MKAKDASTYAIILQTLKSDPTLQPSARSSVQKIRCSAVQCCGALVLQIKKNVDNSSELGAELGKVLSDTATASTLHHTTMIEIRDLDECATKEEIAEALGTSLGARASTRKWLFPRSPTDLATKALELGPHTDWLGQLPHPWSRACSALLQLLEPQSLGTSCSGHCFRCEQASNQIKDCKNNPPAFSVENEALSTTMRHKPVLPLHRRPLEPAEDEDHTTYKKCT